MDKTKLLIILVAIQQNTQLLKAAPVRVFEAIANISKAMCELRNSDETVYAKYCYVLWCKIKKEFERMGESIIEFGTENGMNPEDFDFNDIIEEYRAAMLQNGIKLPRLTEEDL